MIEFLGAQIERKYRQSNNLLYEDSKTTRRPRDRYLELDREVLAFLDKGYKAQNAAQDTLARAYFRTAGNRALRLFDRVPIQALQPYERRQRTSYGELAVIALLEAGDNEQALAFGQRFVDDLLVAQAPKERVKRMIEPDWSRVAPPQPR